MAMVSFVVRFLVTRIKQGNTGFNMTYDSWHTANFILKTYCIVHVLCHIFILNLQQIDKIKKLDGWNVWNSGMFLL